MPGLQEEAARRGQQQSQHWMMLLLFLLPKIIAGIYFIIRHGIKHGWIFLTLGFGIVGVIHGQFPNLHTALHVIIYIAFVSAGIPLMIWKLNWNKRRDMDMHIIIDPDMPDEFYE